MIQTKLNLLREALPYIQKFKGKIFVVKFSGKVTEDKENLASLAEELALLHQVGIKICVIHGGGKQLDRTRAKIRRGANRDRRSARHGRRHFGNCKDDFCR